MEESAVYCALSRRPPAVLFRWAELNNFAPVHGVQSFLILLPAPLSFLQPLVFPLRIQPMLEVDIDWMKLQRKGSFVVQGLANSLAKFLCPPTLLLPLPMVYLPPVWVHLAPAK